MPKTRSASAKGIRITFSDLMWRMLERWDVRPFYEDHVCNNTPPSYYGNTFAGRKGLHDAFSAAKSRSTGWSMVVSPVVLDYLCDEFVPTALDLIDGGGGEWEDFTGRSLWLPTLLRFDDRMKALRAKVRAGE